MTPEQITLVQASFERLGPDLPVLATRFYTELFARDPALRRSVELASACEGAVTPGLFRAATVHAAAAPLSGREREIAMLAAAGIASKDIADRLYLSVRTVNNHLQHAYTKLGVSGRVDLAQALGDIS